jgi:tRNA A64-2'-O-ribosylphosphate transferase
MSTLLPSFLLALHKLNLPLGDLRTSITKPLRPVWVTPESDIVPTSTIFETFHPVVCCTVSRRVIGSEMSEAGYIQGAGDDTENWAHGLTPSIFWANKATLLSAPETELPELIRCLASVSDPSSKGLRCLKPCSQIFIAPISALSNKHDAIITLLPIVTEQGTWKSSQSRMDIGLGPHKLGSRNLRGALPCIMDFVEANLAKRIVIACESGTCLSIGVALAAICLFCDDNGLMQERRVEKVDKNYIRGRLGWISTCMPDANPSRATLQSVNSFLM